MGNARRIGKWAIDQTATQPNRIIFEQKRTMAPRHPSRRRRRRDSRRQMSRSSLPPPRRVFLDCHRKVPFRPFGDFFSPSASSRPPRFCVGGTASSRPPETSSCSPESSFAEPLMPFCWSCQEGGEDERKSENQERENASRVSFMSCYFLAGPCDGYRKQRTWYKNHIVQQLMRLPKMVTAHVQGEYQHVRRS